jgi:hypothetical protein
MYSYFRSDEELYECLEELRQEQKQNAKTEMLPNQLFGAYLNAVCPEVKKSIKKKDATHYETFKPLSSGHKFIYDIEKEQITHLFYRPTYMGGEYGRELVSEVVKVEKTERGFQTIRI